MLAAGELSDGDLLHTQTFVGCKPTAVSAPPSGGDGDGGDDAVGGRNAWRLHTADTNRRLSAADLSHCDPERSDQQTNAARLSCSFSGLGLDSRPADWTWCPELDHGAVVQFKSLMRKKGLSTTQRPPYGSAHRHASRRDSVNTVTLRRRADESFGIHVEMTSQPLKVVVARLNPGGAAGRVSLSEFTWGQGGGGAGSTVAQTEHDPVWFPSELSCLLVRSVLETSW